jgi:prolyl-tRNA synthetase
MVIKPYGYAIWEKMQGIDRMFKETASKCLLSVVPKSMFEAEEKNAEGFAKECAIVTHYRLKNDPDKPVSWWILMQNWKKNCSSY